jgi:hypothetical protein
MNKFLGITTQHIPLPEPLGQRFDAGRHHKESAPPAGDTQRLTSAQDPLEKPVNILSQLGHSHGHIRFSISQKKHNMKRTLKNIRKQDKCCAPIAANIKS